jgi:hypothetical protein
MSLSSTSTLKAQLKGHLGPKADLYFSTLNHFVSGQTSRVEFEESIRAILDAPNLGGHVPVLLNCRSPTHSTIAQRVNNFLVRCNFT